MESVWQRQRLREFPELHGDIRTDVLVVGGGIAGILTAYFLQESGVNCVLVEKNRICAGNTGRTTAKITAQHGLCYHKIAKEHGIEAAELYYRANMRALGRYEAMCGEIACDFQKKDNYIYSVNNRAKLEAEMEVLRKIGVPARFYPSVSIPLTTVGAVCFPDQAQFHPLLFLNQVCRNLQIYEHTVVRELAGNTAITNRGTIHAEKIVCATHFPFINKHGAYFLKLYQSRSYVIGYQNAQDVQGMYADEKEDGLSFRNQGDLLLLGGGGGRTGKPNGNWEVLRQFAREHYPQAEERFAWAAQDCMTLDGMPYVGQYSRRTRDFYVTTGFHKWGMTGSMVAAEIIRDQILGKKNEFAKLLDPSRSVLRKQLWINGVESAKNLLTITPKTCPHLGCALKWNGAEHSWDCPCHGSRFSESGELLDNPATGNLKPDNEA